VIDIDQLKEAFESHFGRRPEGVAEAPGRVNLIGEHLDYNEGLVMPVAIDRAVAVAYASREDPTIRAYSTAFDEEVTFSPAGPFARDDAHPWASYVGGVVAALREAGYQGPGLDLLITGDVPLGAGLSSSAALEVATLGALRAAWRVGIDDRGLALLAQRAENDFVGVQCGIMDQFAAALGVAGHALLIDCRSLEFELVPLRLEEHGLALVVIDSGVRRRLEASDYNARRDECAEALAALRGVMSEPPAALRDVSAADLERYGGCLSAVHLRRARHVVSEMARVRVAVGALRSDDFAMLGELMDASHASLRDDFEVSTPELDRIVEATRGVRGAFGSRLTGAGFGGCTVSLVAEDTVEAVRQRMADLREELGEPGEVYICRPSHGLRLDGAHR
jgi:galactokinase